MYTGYFTPAPSSSGIPTTGTAYTSIQFDGAGDYQLVTAFTDTAGVQSLSFDARKMLDGSLIDSLKWNVREMYDSLGVQSIKYDTRALAGPAGNNTMVWTDTELQLAAGVKITSADHTTAPGTSVGVAIVNFYGTSATNFLGTPVDWLLVKVNGTDRKIPLY